jgi:hypothetical protein
LGDTKSNSKGKGSQAKHDSAPSEKERPFVDKWKCAQQLDNGQKCGKENFYYSKPARTDHTPKTRCAACHKDKKVEAQVSMAHMAETIEDILQRLNGQDQQNATAMPQVAPTAVQQVAPLTSANAGHDNAAIAE